ncbi:MAG: hypothetical protein CMO01_25865 [Thalassobius sp.]|nr:hypothetical protein [Thalassovita sp.]
MKKLFKVAFFYSFIVITTISVAYGIFFINQIRCIMVSYSGTGLREVDNGIYVDPEMDDIEVQLLLLNIEQSRDRVSLFFDSITASPTIIAGPSKDIMKKYGANLRSPGMNHITFLGTYIVLGPGGLNRDVISHELVHSELVSRVGWVNRETKIPTWFDEGLALMLDYRYANSDAMWMMLTSNGKNAPELPELANMHDFMRYTEKSPFFSYVTSMREVSRWWNIVGLEGFNEFSELLKQGYSFEEAYQMTESRYTFPDVGK